MLASKRLAGSVAIARATHATHQIENRPSPVLVRPSVPRPPASGHVMSTDRPRATAHTLATSIVRARTGRMVAYAPMTGTLVRVLARLLAAASAGLGAWCSLGVLAVAHTGGRLGVLPPAWVLAATVAVSCAVVFGLRFTIARSLPLFAALAFVLPWLPGTTVDAFLLFTGPVTGLWWTLILVACLVSGPVPVPAAVIAALERSASRAMACRPGRRTGVGGRGPAVPGRVAGRRRAALSRDHAKPDPRRRPPDREQPHPQRLPRVLPECVAPRLSQARREPPDLLHPRARPVGDRPPRLPRCRLPWRRRLPDPLRCPGCGALVVAGVSDDGQPGRRLGGMGRCRHVDHLHRPHLHRLSRWPVRRVRPGWHLGAVPAAAIRRRGALDCRHRPWPCCRGSTRAMPRSRW